MDEYEKLGLAIPNKEEHTPRPATGIVLALGHEFDPQKTNISIGDMVFFSRYAGADFVIGEEDYRILDVREILCTVEPDEDTQIVTEVVG